MSGAYRVSAQNIYSYVARLSQLGTGDEILKGKDDLETLWARKMVNVVSPVHSTLRKYCTHVSKATHYRD